jgi:putative GTP pyrophosphokinase
MDTLAHEIEDDDGGRLEMGALAASSHEFNRFLMVYKFAIDEITTKINILREEFALLHDYNPIEHVGARLKSPASIVEKARRRSCPLTFAGVRDAIHDIAGVRITCSFLSDVYTIFDMFSAQDDVTVLEVEDYIASPKPNGYQSLHAIVQVPVFLSGGAELVLVEMQFRTIAMDFWASLEHKIYYKYDRAIPTALLDELKEAAETAARLDERMQHLHREVLTLSERRTRA